MRLNSQLIAGGAKWGAISHHPPALPPSGDVRAAATPSLTDRWGKVGDGLHDRTMRVDIV
jgi:hypothetical protein